MCIILSLPCLIFYVCHLVWHWWLNYPLQLSLYLRVFHVIILFSCLLCIPGFDSAGPFLTSAFKKMRSAVERVTEQRYETLRRRYSRQ